MKTVFVAPSNGHGRWRAPQIRTFGNIPRFVAGLLVFMLVPLAMAAPAGAGTLSGTSFTVMDARTNKAGNRYDWGFTTNTANTLSRVTMGVPTGTSGPVRALLLNSAVNGNYASTPDSVDNSVTGDLDVRAQLKMDTWTPPTFQRVIAKWGGAGSAYALTVVSSGKLELELSQDGSTPIYKGSTIATNFAPNSTHWIRSTTTIDNGSGGTDIRFYTSVDGNTWLQLGSTITVTGFTSFFDGNKAVYIGNESGGGAPLGGAISYADIRNGITGTTASPSTCTSSGVVNCFNPSNDAIGGTTWISNSSKAETWTLSRSGTNLPVDIGSSLSVMNISGLPSGGTAQNREIDRLAIYKFPVATSVAAANPISIGLAGFTNTFTAGAYTSAITTFDDSATPVSKDSATTNSVSIDVPTNSIYGGSVSTYPSATPATSVSVRPYGIAVSGTSVYVTDLHSSTVLQLNTSNGTAQTFAGSGATTVGANGVSATSTSFWQPMGIAVDSSGNIFVSDTSQSNIRKISSGTVSLYANNSYTAGYNGDGIATNSYLNLPEGVITDPAGNLYIADASNNCVRKIDTSGNLTTIAGTGTAGGAGDGSAASSAQLNSPTDVAVNSTGDIYLADKGNNRIRRIDHSTSIITTVAGTGASGFNGDNRAATTAQLNFARSISFDSTDNLYIADTANSRIRKVSTAGTITTVAGSGTASFSGDGGPATTATLGPPRQVRVDSAGNVYFADTNNYRVRKVDTAGNISTVLGSGVSPTFNGDGGQVSAARFGQPYQISTNTNGDMFVADANNNAVRKITQWGVVSTVAGQGPQAAGFSGDGGAATIATLSNPQGVAVAADGTIYIADTSNGRIRKVTTDGVISTFATVTYPQRVSVSPAGEIYVSTLCQVLKYTTSAVSSIFAGTTTCAFSGDGGVASTATLSSPKELAFDSLGNTYISDSGNGVVRMVNAGGIIKTVAGGGVSGSDNVPATSRSLLGSVRGIAVDGTGAIYINIRQSILRFTVGGPIVTVSNFGNKTPGGGMTILNGSIYVTDYNYQVVRKVADVFPLAPNVNADSLLVPMNTARSWPILSNDWAQDKEMDPNSVTVTQPAHGIVSLTIPTTEASTLQANYTPATSYTGPDAFTYTACDTTLQMCSTATVSISVSSNQVTTVAGGLSEGLGVNIGGFQSRVTKFKNYLFYTDTQFGVIRRYDIYSKQSVVVAGNGATTNLGDGGPATAASINGPRKVAFSPDGTMYVGVAGAGVIRIVTTAGMITLLGAVPSPSAIAFGLDGALYVTTNSTTIKVWNGSLFVTYAGTPSSGTSGDGGLAINATWTTTSGLLVSPSGDLYVTDSTDCTLRVIRNGFVYAVAGIAGQCGASGDGGAATAANINGPLGLSIDSSGAILLSDSGNSRIRKIDSGGTITTAVVSGITFGDVRDVIVANSTDMYVVDSNRIVYVAVNGVASVKINSGNSASYAGDGTGALQSQISSAWPDGLALDATGNLYVATTSARIRKFDSNGIGSTIVGNGNSGYGSNQIQGDPGQIAFDSLNRPVFADRINNIVRRIDGPGSMTTVAGIAQSGGHSGDGGPATSAQLSAPWGLAIASDGTMYVGEATYIRKVSPGGVISTIAGTGLANDTGDGGPAVLATLNEADSLALDGAGNLYFGEKSGCRVRMIDRSGVITSLAGNGVCGATADGNLSQGNPIGIVNGMAIDAESNIYISESSTPGGIRKISSSTGILSTPLGKTSAGLVDNTTYDTARLSTPRSIFIDRATGDLYVMDQNNNRVRKASTLASTAANNLSSVSWSVVPGASGHPNLRERFVITPSATVTSSKMVFTMPPSFAGSASVVEAFGLTGVVSASVSGATLTVSYPSQTIPAGIKIAISIEGITNGGANGSYSTGVNLYDSAGSTAIGWARSNIVYVTSSGTPGVSDAGYGSMWMRSTTVSSSGSLSMNLSPASVTAASTSMTVSSGGNLNSNSLTIRSTSLSKLNPLATFNPVSPDINTGVSAGAFGVGVWGTSVSTSTGTVQGQAFNFVGTTSSPQAFVSGANATNTFSITARAKVGWLVPAGSYLSTMTYRLVPGT